MLNNKNILKGLAVASGVTIGLIATGVGVSANSNRPYNTTNQNEQNTALLINKLETPAENVNAPHNQLSNQRAQLGTYVKSQQETGQIRPMAKVIYPQASNNYDQVPDNYNSDHVDTNINGNSVVHFDDVPSYNNQNNVNNVPQPPANNGSRIKSRNIVNHIGHIKRAPNRDGQSRRLDSGYAKFIMKFNTLNSIYDHNLSTTHHKRATIKPKAHKIHRHHIYEHHHEIIRKNKVSHIIKRHHIKSHVHINRARIQRYNIKRIRSIERREARLVHQQHIERIYHQARHVSAINNAAHVSQTKHAVPVKHSAEHARRARRDWFTDGLSKRQLAARNWISWHESGHHWYILSYGHRCVGYFQLDPAYLGYKHGHVNLNPRHQVKVADRYVRNRYGTWHRAKAFWEYHHWY